MMHDNDVGNSEKNGSEPRTDRDKDVSVPNEKFLFKEPIVLIAIVCLSMLNAISFNLPTKSILEIPIDAIYDLSPSVVPAIGLMFAAFLSDVTGRKNVYRYFFALSLFSSILAMSSNHPTVMCVLIVLYGILKGGSSVLSAIAISEYSSPRHRFTWLILDKAAFNIVSLPLNSLRIKSNIILYVLLGIQIVLGLICLGSTWVWPESPYWLANRGKLEQSREAFLWLRGEGGRGEMVAVLQARRDPGPAKLFWISLFVALATMLVSTFSELQILQSSIYFFYLCSSKRDSLFFIHLFGIAVITCILIAVSYFVTRKLVFIVVSVISFVVCYAEALCMYVMFDGISIDSLSYYFMHVACYVMQISGPAVLGANLSIEIVPFKYNTCISCIWYVAMFLSLAILMPLSMYNPDGSLHPSAFLALYTTFALVAALLYYFFAPETKDKTLLEIQRSYTPKENYSNTETQNQSVVRSDVI